MPKSRYWKSNAGGGVVSLGGGALMEVGGISDGTLDAGGMADDVLKAHMSKSRHWKSIAGGGLGSLGGGALMEVGGISDGTLDTGGMPIDVLKAHMPKSRYWKSNAGGGLGSLGSGALKEVSDGGGGMPVGEFEETAGAPFLCSFGVLGAFVVGWKG
ncbi:hypothetical protein N7522_007582 [Penicillium canescens]|nr:hypothetical protein N7522_007582 [Penicillium canescens]